MEDMDSVLIHRERENELRQKLVNATLELETMKNIKAQLFNLLKMACQERDEARCQLQKLLNKFTPSSPTNLQNIHVGVVQNNNESLLMFPSAKANSSNITESDSFSLGSPPQVESLSSPEFSNFIDSNNSNNLSYLNQNLVQDFNNCLASSEKVVKYDPANAVIDCIAKQRGLPQKGKLLQAVMDSGPLLHNLPLAGPLPNWKNPPPLKDIKVPPLTITPIEPNSISDTGNSFLKPKMVPSLYSSNAPSSCSASMLNFAGQTTSSWNNAWQFSSSGVGFEFPSRKRQRHQ